VSVGFRLDPSIIVKNFVAMAI